MRNFKINDCNDDGGLAFQAGELFEKLGRNESAIEYYCKAHCYQKGVFIFSPRYIISIFIIQLFKIQFFYLAVELARNVMPQNVVKLEEEWGNYLVTQKRYDSAINHFIESGLVFI